MYQLRLSLDHGAAELTHVLLLAAHHVDLIIGLSTDGLQVVRGDQGVNALVVLLGGLPR